MLRSATIAEKIGWVQPETHDNSLDLPIMSPVPAYSWTGVYVGVNGGGAWGSQDPLNLITNRFAQAA
jgi:hypothetical protein